MAFVTRTITGDLRQMFGDSIDLSTVRGYAETNLGVGQAMIFDLANDRQYLGSGRLTINQDGSWELTDIPDWNNVEADQNPTHVQVQVRFEYVDAIAALGAANARKTKQWSSGYLEVDADGTIGEFVAQQLAPADWRSDFMDTAEGLLAQQQEISGLTGEDAAMASIAGNPASAFASVQSATIAQAAAYPLPLVASTTNLTTLLAAALSAGHTNIVIPLTTDMPAGGWPMTSLATVPADTTIRFQPGAKVDLQMSTKAFSFGARCQLIDFYLTSAFTGPSSANDNFDKVGGGGSAAYVYDARGVVLEDYCRVENYYQEYASAGLEFQGEYITVKKAHLKHIQQYQGWGSAIHAGGTPGGSSPMKHCHVEDITLEDCDRGLEIEAGASFNTFVKGYLKNVGAAGYTGQPAGLGPNGDVYADYTFILDCHSHLNEATCQSNIFRDFRLVDCRGGITAVRSNGSNDSDLPRNNVWENITIEGRAGTTGYESVYIQGHGNKVKNLVMLPGAGVTAKMRVLIADAGSESNEVEIAEASGYALPLVQVGTGNSPINTKIKAVVRSAPTTGTGYLFDVYGINTRLDLTIRDVTGTTGYLNLRSTATGSSTEKFDYTVATAETFTQVALVGASQAQINGIKGYNRATTPPKDIDAPSGSVAGLTARGTIDRLAGVSVGLGGATSGANIGALDMALGTIADTGQNNARSGSIDLVSTAGDNEMLAAFLTTLSTTTPITWPTANLGIGKRVRVGRRASLTRFRFKVVTQAGNYYAGVTNSAGVVLWKTATTLPAAGIVSLTMTGVEVQPGELVIPFLALSSTSAAVAGVAVNTGDQNLLATVKGAPGSLAIANLYTSNPIAGATITLGSTLPAFIPMITLIEV